MCCFFPDEPQEGVSQHPPRPKPPTPSSRPVAVVAASPRGSSPTDSPRSADTEHTGPSPVPVPVPAARPKSSPRDQPPEGSAEPKAQPSEPLMDMPQGGVPDRPKPPVPTSRPRVPPSGSPPPACPPRLPEPAVPSRPPPPTAAASPPPVPRSHPSRPAGGGVGGGGGGGGGGGLPPPLLPSKPPPPLLAAAAPAAAAEGSLYAVSDPLEESLDRLQASSFSSEASQPSRPPPPVPKTRPQPAPSPSSMVGRPLPSVPSQSSSDSPSSEQGHLYEDVDAVKAETHTLAKLPHSDSDPMDKAKVTARERNPAVVEAPVVESEDDIAAMYATVNKPKKHNSAQSSVAANSSQAESVASNPFGIKLKHVAHDSSPESESAKQPGPQNKESEDAEMKRPPVLAAKPKPGVLPKPQPAAKPKSPGKEDVLPETAAAPSEASAKPDPPEPSRPPLTAKRPTIIRPSRPAPKSGDADQSDRSEEDGSAGVQLREKSAAASHPVPRPQSELGEESKVLAAAEPPAPSRRPVTIIGFPKHRQKKLPDSEAGEAARNTSPPVPRQRLTLGGGSPRDEGGGEVNNGSLPAGDHHASLGEPERVRGAAPPPGSRPPPPRPDNKPPRPQAQPSPPPESTAGRKSESEATPPRPPSPAPQAQPSPPPEPTAGGKRESEVTPPRPPSPAPPRPASRPAPPSKEAVAASGGGEVGGASAVPSSTPRFAPPIKRKGSSEDGKSTV